MGIYDRGRPKKVNYDGTKGVPHQPGEYRIRDEEQHIAYIGETNDLQRRAKEHQKSGKFGEHSTFEFKVANESSSEGRREHERRSIKKHNPYLNKSIGGEGRPAHVNSLFNDTVEFNDVYEGKKPFILFRIIKWIFRLLFKLVFAIVLLAIALIIISIVLK